LCSKLTKSMWNQLDPDGYIIDVRIDLDKVVLVTSFELLGAY